MTRHLVRLIWNRRRTNMLVAVEILISFLVLFGVVTLAVYYANNYRQPLGFDYEDVLAVEISTHRGVSPSGVAHTQETLRQLLLAARDFDEVVSVAACSSRPYSDSTWEYDSTVDGLRIEYQANEATEGLDDVLDLQLVRGRWFDAADNGASYQPVVITTSLSRHLFGDGNPIGRSIPQERPRDESAPKDKRIVGELAAYRDHGEFTLPVNFVFARTRLDDPTDTPPRVLLLELRPGTTAAFEEQLVKRFQAVAKEWSFEPRMLEEARADTLRTSLSLMAAVGVVAAFLMLMVAMGLTGVLWQTVTERRREVGVRRAKGASARNIHRQVLAELGLMTTLALIPGVALLVQFPLLDLLGWVSPGVFTTSLALSVAAIYLLTLACGWYPSRMATRIQPAEALHYE